MRRIIATVALVGVLFTGVAVAHDVADPEPAAAHYTVTALPYDVCAWTGVRDGVLGNGLGTRLEAYYNFWYVDHYWVYCRARISFEDAHCWIVSRHDGFTMHLGPC
jgi:hypothetical protein